MTETNSQPIPRWEHFSHGADIGVRGMGATQAGAFSQAALALTAVITDPSCITPVATVTLKAQAPDAEILLVDFLNALIFEMATRNMLFSRFDVHIEDSSLRATAWGEIIDVGRHQPAVEVKGATYTALRVAKEKEQWVAQCVVDV